MMSWGFCHTDAPFTAKLETGSAMINKLWSNILWGQRSNFVGVPTDCPQRDERLGWMARCAGVLADGQLQHGPGGLLAEVCRGYARNASRDAVLRHLRARDRPAKSGFGAGWSDAGVIIPWTSWLQTGDTSIIEENWAAMEKYLDAIAAANPDGLRKNDAGIPFGDWLSPEGRTDHVLIATAYWAYDVTLMQRNGACHRPHAGRGEL